MTKAMSPNMDDLEKAKTCFMQALSEFQVGDLSAAETLLRQALDIAPDRTSVLTNLSAVLLKQKRPDEARLYAMRSVELDPDNAEGWLNVANSQDGLGHHEEALASYDRSITLNSDYAEAWLSRGKTQESLMRYAEALISYDRAIVIKPDYPEAWFNRGNALNCLRQHEEALISYDRAIVIKPDYAESFSNRGNALVHLKRFREALASYDRAISLDPCYALAHFNRSVCWLLLGEFNRGWKEYEWRWDIGKYGHKPSFEMPIWSGERVDGVLLTWGEQGLGDQILHASMLKQLAPLCKQLVLAVEPRLVDLTQRSFPEICVVTNATSLPEQSFDAWLPLGDLGIHFRKSWEDFPLIPPPYLIVDPDRSARLRERLTQGKKRVCGISWISNNNEFGRHKSIRLLDLLEILRIPGIEFVDLQYGDTRKERENIQIQESVHLTRVDEVDNTNDIDGLAAVINACDIVVTISNTTAHLAGALGKEVFLMLPYSQGLIWYWHENRDDSPWYPATRLFRQARPNAWGAVISRVAQEIQRRISQLNA